MVGWVFRYIARRRRFILEKVSVLALLLMTFVIWRLVEKPSWISKNNENKDSRIETGDAVDPNEEISSDIKFLRDKALRENLDEFMTPILKEFSFSEVDLAAVGIPSLTNYDEEIKDDLTRVKRGLGDGGVKATVPSYQQNDADEIIKKEAFNRVLSEMISPNRSTPDTREEACRSEVYDHELPDMSVVIIFTNEALTTLVRTLHSVVNRTPKRLLNEIILVDDVSDHRDLKGKLERYLATHFKLGLIRLIRLNRRAGLIRARMIGAHFSIGDVILFLDAHCEASVGWAEPLLQRIKEDRRAVVCPIIDLIDDKTLEYSSGGGEDFQIGGFTWSGHFKWINIPLYEERRKTKHNSPTRSPTMIGCKGNAEVFLESKEGISGRLVHMTRIWRFGEERTWKCHLGTLSHLDEFKELFYSHRKELKVADYGSVSKRIEFRNRMQCKSFKWFLDNIYIEQFQMQFHSVAYGQIKNKESGQCLDTLHHSETKEYTLSVYTCHTTLSPSQIFMLSNKGELRREVECARVDGNDNVQMVKCENLQEKELWDLKDNQISSRLTGKCLTLEKDGRNYSYLVKIKDCVDSPYQKWSIGELKQEIDL